MPQIGWLEILSIIIIAILVLGPKEFPIALKKIGTYIGKFKKTLSNFQKEVSSVTQNIDIEEDRKSHNLPKNGVILGSLNQSFKLEPIMFDAWIDILQKHKIVFYMLHQLIQPILEKLPKDLKLLKLTIKNHYIDLLCHQASPFLKSLKYAFLIKKPN